MCILYEFVTFWNLEIILPISSSCLQDGIRNYSGLLTPLHMVIRAHLDRKIVNAMLFLIACKHSHLHAVTCLTNSVDTNNLRMQAHEGFLVT